MLLLFLFNLFANSKHRSRLLLITSHNRQRRRKQKRKVQRRERWDWFTVNLFQSQSIETMHNHVLIHLISYKMELFVVELVDINSDRSSFSLAREGILYYVVHVDIVDEDPIHAHR